MRTLVEACVASLADARAAVAAGADRLELCGPGDGGTTPSAGLLERCLAESPVPVHVMIRAHTRDFTANGDWRFVMQSDIAHAQRIGAHGVVVGPLHRDGTIDVETLERFRDAAVEMHLVFHRAFDRVPDAERALDQLLQLGVGSVLTSGGTAQAAEESDRLRGWQQRTGNALTILAGGGVRAHCVAPLLQPAGLRAVHAAATDHTAFASLVSAVRTLDAKAAP